MWIPFDYYASTFCFLLHACFGLSWSETRFMIYFFFCCWMQSMLVLPWWLPISFPNRWPVWILNDIFLLVLICSCPCIDAKSAKMYLGILTMRIFNSMWMCSVKMYQLVLTQFLRIKCEVFTLDTMNVLRTDILTLIFPKIVFIMT